VHWFSLFARVVRWGRSERPWHGARRAANTPVPSRCLGLVQPMVEQEFGTNYMLLGETFDWPAQ
jgi:hypothetical protein